jgi:hypothetical protein
MPDKTLTPELAQESEERFFPREARGQNDKKVTAEEELKIPYDKSASLVPLLCYLSCLLFNGPSYFTSSCILSTARLAERTTVSIVEWP